jgi:hypothetical protein
MSRFQPALLGGLFIGVLSSLPFVNALNACCCLWVVCGGVLVTYLLQQRTPDPVGTTDAALQGLMAGAIGGAIFSLGQMFIFQLTGPMVLEEIRGNMDQAQMPPEARAFIERLFTSQGFALVLAFVTIPVYAVFSMAGSFLGLAFFRKKLPPTPQA